METITKPVEKLVGRELDAAVAEEVMGWERATIPEPRVWRSGRQWFASGEIAGLCAADGDTEEEARRRWHEAAERAIMEWLPHYSTDIAAAWEVWEWLASRGEYPSHLALIHDANKYRVVRGTNFTSAFEVDFLGSEGEGATAPEAICRAALAVVRAVS